MAIYRMVGDKDDLEPIPVTSFGEEGVLERQDLQRILRDKPDILEPGLFVVSEEFGEWTDSSRRIDLLCLDSDGRLVVVELKRGERGEHMDLQAIRYAAMVANMTFRQLVDTHQAYLDKRAQDDGKPTESDAESSVREHLGIVEEEEPVIHTEIPRIILASEGFSKELTTFIMWLNDSWLKQVELEIKCIRLVPHRMHYENGKEILVETSQIVPLPEAGDYLIRIRERESEVQKQLTTPPYYIKGGDAFKEIIEKSPGHFQPELNRLYAWATSMEHAGLVKLDTHLGKTNTMRLLVPGGSGLITVVRTPTGSPCIHLWRSVFEKHASKSIKTIEGLIGSFGKGTSINEPSDALLDALTAAYQEAKEKLAGSGDGE